MSLRPKKINFKKISDTKTNQKIEPVEIVCIDKPYLDEHNVSLIRDNKNKGFPELIYNILKLNNMRGNFDTQKEAFNAAMKYLLFLAKIFGIFPILNFKEKNVPKPRLTIFSWRYSFCMYMSVIQLVATILCLRSLMSSAATLTKFAYLSFYFTTFLSTVHIMRLSTKWNYLMKHLEIAELNEYVDPRVAFRCNFAVILIVALASVEHLLSTVVKLTATKECTPNGTDVLKQTIKHNFYWLFELDMPYSTGLSIFLVIQNYIVSMIWSYLHLFVICMSLFLSSILAQITKVILSQEGQYLPPSYWRKLREDFNRATQLVRSFDDGINYIVLISFASNLFYVCLQLFYLLSTGLHLTHCHNANFNGKLFTNHSTGLFYGYISVSYAIYSLVFVVLRSFAVALIAAKVHSTSLLAAPALYSVPSPTFCTEVQRFIEQIHGTTVGLTGLNLFYVNKELILSIIGTIVTYELVLLQFVQNE